MIQKIDVVFNEDPSRLIEKEAFIELEKNYTFPIQVSLAFADQIIYRFSKAQDSMGAKLFKAYILAQGSNVDKPFLDILHSLKK